MDTDHEDDDGPALPDPEGYLEADNFAEVCLMAAEFAAMDEANLRRAKDLCAIGCDYADVNGWPARLHVALNGDDE
jgi:hypothetical protein